VSTITTLQKELANTEFAKKDAAKDAEVCMRAAQEQKAMVDQLLAQVTQKLKYGVLDRTIIDASTELRIRSLNLERTTTTKGDFQWHTAKLTRKLEGKMTLILQPELIYIMLTLF
jgi:hypothetical protein